MPTGAPAHRTHGHGARLGGRQTPHHEAGTAAPMHGAARDGALASGGGRQELTTDPGGAAGRTGESRGLACTADLINLRAGARSLSPVHTSTLQITVCGVKPHVDGVLGLPDPETVSRG